MSEHTAGFGTVTIGDDGRATLRFIRDLPHPPERVWAALTESDQLAAWLMKGTIEPRVGGRLHLESGEAGGTVGEVLRCDAPHLLVYTWARDGGIGPASTVMWQLAQIEQGTRLVLEHADLDTSFAYDLGAGWHDFLDRLPWHLADWDLSGWTDEYELLLLHYRRRVTNERSGLFTGLAPVLNVRDLAAERAFYERLGLPVIYEGEEYPNFVAFGTDTVHFGIQAASVDNDPPSVLTWQIGVSDVAAAELCRTAGLEFETEQNDPAPGWSYRRLILRTPSGYRLALEGPRESTSV